MNFNHKELHRIHFPAGNLPLVDVLEVKTHNGVPAGKRNKGELVTLVSVPSLLLIQDVSAAGRQLLDRDN